MIEFILIISSILYILLCTPFNIMIIILIIDKMPEMKRNVEFYVGLCILFTLGLIESILFVTITKSFEVLNVR